MFPAIWTALQERHPDARVFVESPSHDGLLFLHALYAQEGHAGSPMADLAQRAYVRPKEAEAWVHVDARRFPLYHVWEAFVNPVVYALWASHVQGKMVEMTHVQSKLLEKEWIQHMTSKRAMRTWLGAMMFQNTLPGWYAVALNTFGGGATAANPIYEAFRALPKKHQRLVRTYFKEATSLTVVTKALPGTRRTASMRHVFVKHPSLARYFVSMYSVVMDVYAITQLLATPTTTPCIFVGGFEHAWNVGRFLHTHCGVVWNQPLPMPTYVLHLEQAFLEPRGVSEWEQNKELYLQQAEALLASRKAIVRQAAVI